MYRIGPLAQLVEQDTLNVKVVGSTPTWLNFNKRISYRGNSRDNLYARINPVETITRRDRLVSFNPSMTKNYEIFEHTADIGVRITGKDIKDLFKNAGLAIFQISSRKQFTKDKKHTVITIKQKAKNLEELFINWLNELISLSAANGLVFHNIKVNKLEDNNLEAICTGSNILNYKVNIEIKAATYCELKIEKIGSSWVAKVIFDV